MRLSVPGQLRCSPKQGRGSAYVSHCTVCGLAILEDQPRVWATGRVLGLCHAECHAAALAADEPDGVT